MGKWEGYRGLNWVDFPLFGRREGIKGERELFWFAFNPETLVKKFLPFHPKLHGISFKFLVLTDWVHLRLWTWGTRHNGGWG